MSTAAPYHHGNLRAALVDAAVDAAREAGPDGLTVRDLARRVGVSHNAAYRHFADRDALVAEVARHGLGRMVSSAEERLAAIDEPDAVRRARRRLQDLGRAYVAFALGEPGLFRVVFDAYPAVATTTDDDVTADWPDPLGQLGEALDGLVEVGYLHPDHRPGAEIACWSAVHGFAMLHLTGPLRDVPASERDQALTHLLDTIDRGYGATTGHV